jgi:hypothetical protein
MLLDFFLARKLWTWFLHRYTACAVKVFTVVTRVEVTKLFWNGSVCELGPKIKSFREKKKKHKPRINRRYFIGYAASKESSNLFCYTVSYTFPIGWKIWEDPLFDRQYPLAPPKMVPLAFPAFFCGPPTPWGIRIPSPLLTRW